jgi:hypothetical protein
MSEADLSRLFLARRIPYVKPLYSIKFSDKKAVLDWVKDASNNLSQYYEPLFREQRQNLSLFLGLGINPNFATPFAATYATTSDVYSDPQMIYINEVYRSTIAQVSLIVSNELIPDVLPNSEDYSDKVACNVTKEWLESLHYDLNTEAWRYRWELQKKIFGEAFAIPRWNADIGDLHPDAKKYVDEDLDLLDEDGNPILDLSDQPMKIRKNQRIGDIEYVNPYPWCVFIDPDKARRWFMWSEDHDVEYLKKKYPKFDWESSKTTDTSYDPFTNSEKDNPNRRTIFYLYHKADEFIPEGKEIICSPDFLIKNGPLPYPTLIDAQDLPVVHFKDMDIGFGSRGAPMLFRNIRSLSDGYNQVTNQIANNIEMESPKLFVHQDANVDAQRMPNGISAVEWTGNIKPTIETPSTNTSGIFNFREALKKNIDEMALQTPMVRGDVPNAQLDSFIALQHFEDQRVQLASPDIKGDIRAMEQLYRLEISIARDKYKPSDQRLIKILGRHNSYQLKYFDPINLEKSYDVKISTTGNLANSKAARTQMMMTIKRDFPELIADEVFLDMLGLSHSKKFMNAITAAVSSAESENQDMMDGKPVESPTRYEDLIAHWDTHRIPMQTLDFKHSDPEIQETFMRHVAATEKLMFEQGAENPLFLEKLAALRQFPMFYTPRPVNELPIAPDQVPMTEAV